LLTGFLVLFLLASGIIPEPAYGGWIGDRAASVVKKIFGVEGDWISGTLVQWVIRIQPPGLTSDGAGAALYLATRDFAFASLGAVLTLSVIHYWAAGFTSQGGGAGVAIEGLLRTMGAALFILAWPFMIDTAVELAGIMRDELVPGAKLDAANLALFGGASLACGKVGATSVAACAKAGSAKLAGGALSKLWGAGLIVGIILVCAIVLLGLALFVTKIMLSVALLTLAGMMPLALVLWAIPSLSFFANGMLRACAAIVAIQIAWAGEVFLYAWIGTSDWLTFSGPGSVLDKLMGPIMMIALWLLMLLTAPWVMRLSGMGGGNFLAFLGGSLVARFGHAALAQRFPDVMGGRSDSLQIQRLKDQYMVAKATEQSAASRAGAEAKKAGQMDKAWKDHAAEGKQQTKEARQRAGEMNRAFGQHERERAARTGGLGSAQAQRQGMQEHRRAGAAGAADDTRLPAAASVTSGAGAGVAGSAAGATGGPTGEGGGIGGYGTVGAAGYEYGRLGQDLQGEVSRVQYGPGSAAERAQGLEQIAGRLGNSPQRDSILGLARTDDDLRTAAIPGPGQSPPSPTPTPAGGSE
jgi:hypothetical protein